MQWSWGEGAVAMECPSYRTGTVQAKVTWRQGKVQWSWGVHHIGRGQFRRR